MVQTSTMTDVFLNCMGRLLGNELIDQKGGRPPHADDGGDGHDGAEADFRGAGLSGFRGLGDSFGGGGLGSHGVSPML